MEPSESDVERRPRSTTSDGGRARRPRRCCSPCSCSSRACVGRRPATSATARPSTLRSRLRARRTRTASPAPASDRLSIDAQSCCPGLKMNAHRSRAATSSGTTSRFTDCIRQACRSNGTYQLIMSYGTSTRPPERTSSRSTTRRRRRASRPPYGHDDQQRRARCRHGQHRAPRRSRPLHVQRIDERPPVDRCAVVPAALQDEAHRSHRQRHLERRPVHRLIRQPAQERHATNSS